MNTQIFELDAHDRHLDHLAIMEGRPSGLPLWEARPLPASTLTTVSV